MSALPVCGEQTHPSLPCCADDQLHSVAKHICGSIEWRIFTFLLYRLHTIHSFDLGLLLLWLKLHGQWIFVCVWISSRLTLVLTQIFVIFHNFISCPSTKKNEFGLSVVLFTHVHVCSNRANMYGMENGPSSFIKVLLSQQWCINSLLLLLLIKLCSQLLAWHVSVSFQTVPLATQETALWILALLAWCRMGRCSSFLYILCAL